VTPNRHRSAVIEFPNDLEILVMESSKLPSNLFSTYSPSLSMCAKPSPHGEEVKMCAIDLRLGGSFHLIFVTDDLLPFPRLNGSDAHECQRHCLKYPFTICNWSER
jgi:hypothetical protein